MVRLLKEHLELTNQMVEDLLQDKNPFEHKLSAVDDNKTILHSREGKPIRAKTKNQRLLVESSEKMTSFLLLVPQVPVKLIQLLR